VKRKGRGSPGELDQKEWGGHIDEEKKDQKERKKGIIRKTHKGGKKHGMVTLLKDKKDRKFKRIS